MLFATGRMDVRLQIENINLFDQLTRLPSVFFFKFVPLEKRLIGR